MGGRQRAVHRWIPYTMHSGRRPHQFTDLVIEEEVRRVEMLLLIGASGNELLIHLL
jgi:hypothetical protein